MPALFVYEPRMLLRTAVTHLLGEEGTHVQSFQVLSHLKEQIYACTADNKILLAGLSGAGANIAELLQLIRQVKSLKVKTLVWVSAEYPWMFKILNAIYTVEILEEEALASRLQSALNGIKEASPQAIRQQDSIKRERRITLTELDILLQFAAGLSSREMADIRHCNYKTIFSWKHNICEALNIETHAQWLEMLTEIVQLSSIYQTGINNDSL